MLILTRRVGESLMIGDDVSITVLGIKGNQVRLGVNAPKEISVHREEIYQRIQQEKAKGQEEVPSCVGAAGDLHPTTLSSRAAIPDDGHGSYRDPHNSAAAVTDRAERQTRR